MGFAQDADGRSLWDLTWARARGISSGLQPQLLAASGPCCVGAGSRPNPGLARDTAAVEPSAKQTVACTAFMACGMTLRGPAVLRWHASSCANLAF